MKGIWGLYWFSLVSLKPTSSSTLEDAGIPRVSSGPRRSAPARPAPRPAPAVSRPGARSPLSRLAAARDPQRLGGAGRRGQLRGEYEPPRHSAAVRGRLLPAVHPAAVAPPEARLAASRPLGRAGADAGLLSLPGGPGSRAPRPPPPSEGGHRPPGAFSCSPSFLVASSPARLTDSPRTVARPAAFPTLLCLSSGSWFH